MVDFAKREREMERGRGEEGGLGGRKRQPPFRNSSHTYPTHHPIGGVSGTCMIGVCNSREKRNIILTPPLQCVRTILIHFLLQNQTCMAGVRHKPSCTKSQSGAGILTVHSRNFTRSHQLIVLSHLPAPIRPRNNQHTINKLQMKSRW